MRRKDREVTDLVKIEEIIAACECMRLGLNDDGKVYIVPVNYGYTCENGMYTFYVHGAAAGRKYEVIKRSPEIGFELDRNVSIVTADTGCGHTALYQSIIGNGTASFIENAEEKKAALNLIMKKNTGKDGWEFDPAVLERTCVYKIEVAELSCKENAK